MGKGKGFSFNQMVVIIALVLGGVGATYYFTQPASISGQAGIVEPTTTDACEDTQCFQNPSYTYSATDKFTASAIGGTDYIKAGNKDPVTSLAAPEKCQTLQYWKDNGSYFTEVVTTTAKCGANQVQSTSWSNASVTLAMYDDYTTVASASHNVTMGANDVKNLDLTYQASAKAARMPFGGCMCIEYPTTLSYVKPSGAGISDTSCRFVKTYAVSSTSNTYRCYDVPTGFDAAGDGSKKTIGLQAKASSSNPSGTMYVKFYPANYYITNDGDFALGVEEDLNDATTVTFNGAESFTAVIV